MLQVKNLVKIYKPKKGVPVQALNNVTLTFPEKGMVFLLGKSGSGKSTLLNILGGLDRYNSGDILVLGKSTKKWKQSHFDSYRNTYVGFIFQEYNILNEFSVGANIGLALQLQGQKPTTEQINSILRQVDLEGYGNRNPNELSGGQKQRVAIARALVKNPKIIMADEPTGALDSNTGRQVLTTLKKLSQDKLVIVVSHDREFAEQYADRIVELADGKVIRDIERLQTEDISGTAVPVYMEDSVSLPEEYVLTQTDKDAICDYIQKMIGIGKQPRFSLFSKRSSAFQPTDESRIAVSQDGYKLIKSRLPIKYAFKLGASGLKHKKFRLVMTILLSCIALGLFGLTDTFASYDYVSTALKSLTDPENQINYVAFERESRDEDGAYFYETRFISEEDITRIKTETGLDVYPVHALYTSVYDNLPEESHYNNNGYYMTDFGGAIVADDNLLNKMDAKLIAGHLPEKGEEVVISTHMLETFIKYGYTEINNYEKGPTERIFLVQDILGKTLTMGEQSVTICGVVDTGLKFDRYATLKEIDTMEMAEMSFAEQIGFMALQMELDYARRYSLTGLLMVSPGFINHFCRLDPYSGMLTDSTIIQTLSPMPKSEKDIRKLVEFSDKDFDASKGVLMYNLMNPVTFELKNLDEIFLVLSQVFFWIGVVFVVFSSLLFSNFIATSISYKKEQIGILRAIGSRSNDVFRIFFAESFIIAMINFTLSFVGTIVVCGIINSMVKSGTGLLLTILTVGIRQAVLLFAVCLLCAFIACYLPVRKIAAKKPIDAIRDR